MNSIEETIKIIKRKIKEAKHYSDITGLCLTLDEELRNSLMNILSDYKRLLKENEQLRTEVNSLKEENEELEEINNELEAVKNEAIRRYNFETIPIRKIKDKIEEIQEEGYWLFTTDRDSDKCVEVLQELLESEE